MSAAKAAYPAITSDLTTEYVGTCPLGWVGSKAVNHGDFVTYASGYFDQAHATGGAVSTSTLLAIAVTDLASTVAAASSDALAFQALFPGDTTLIELSVVNGSDTLVTPATSDVGTVIGLYRRSTGEYCADKNGTVSFKVQEVDLTRGTMKGTIPASLQLK